MVNKIVDLSTVMIDLIISHVPISVGSFPLVLYFWREIICRPPILKSVQINKNDLGF